MSASSGRRYVPTGAPRGRPPSPHGAKRIRNKIADRETIQDELIWQSTPTAMERFLADLRRICPLHDDAQGITP